MNVFTIILLLFSSPENSTENIAPFKNRVIFMENSLGINGLKGENSTGKNSAGLNLGIHYTVHPVFTIGINYHHGFMENNSEISSGFYSIGIQPRLYIRISENINLYGLMEFGMVFLQNPNIKGINIGFGCGIDYKIKKNLKIGVILYYEIPKWDEYCDGSNCFNSPEINPWFAGLNFTLILDL
jgi:hypothetical protein